MSAISHVPGIVWPPLLTGDAARVAALADRLEASEWDDSEKIAARQFERLQLLAAHHAAHSPQFARRLAAAGLDAVAVATPEGLAALPPLTRREVQGATDLFADVPEAHLPLDEARTSGATGEPVTVRRTIVSQLDWMAMAMRDHRWHRRDLAGRLAAVREYAKGITQLPDWGPPASLLRPTGPSLLIGAATDAPAQLAALRAFRPASLLAYPSQIAALLRLIEEDGRGLPGLAEVRTLGEALPPELRGEVRRVVGARLTDGYSSQEIGYLALQCPSGEQYHVMAETVLLEVVDETGRAVSPGTMGRVLVTDLRNFATPLVRYANGDLAVAGEACGCWRGLPVLERIVGRTRDLVTAPNGARYWANLGKGPALAAAGVRQFKLVQRDRMRIDAYLFAEPRPDAASEAAVRAELLEVLAHPFALTLHWRDAPIAPGSSGKFSDFTGLGD